MAANVRFSNSAPGRTLAAHADWSSQILGPRGFDQRGALVFGVVLILVGAFALLGQTLAGDVFKTAWPLFVIVPGVLLFAAAIAVGDKAGVALAIAGATVTMTGIVLGVQMATGLWSTWAYAWALVAPGGAGVGLLAYGIVTGQREFVRAGTPILTIGIGLFFGFGLFFEGVIGLSGRQVTSAGPALAIGLIAIGGLLVISGVVGRRAPAV
jgi:hypothetical protein